MKTPVDKRFAQEAAEFELRFLCSSCAHFDSADRSCGEGYPTTEHDHASVEELDHVVFCKAFELS